jgi:hypothetical protein
MDMVGRVLTAVSGVMAGLVLTAAPSHADEHSFPVVGTDIGIYPRSAPSMASERVGAALANGETVQVVCETTGEAVDNGYAPSDVWARLSDGTFLPNAFLLTGVDGRSPGVEDCSSVAGPPVQGEDLSAAPSAAPGAVGWPKTSDCATSSPYVSKLSVSRYEDGQFKISLTPHWWARVDDPWPTTLDEWSAVQSCMGGLSGPLADSVFAQLYCHQALAAFPGRDGGLATGPSYELESWRGMRKTGFVPDYAYWVSVRCGNGLHEELDR